MLFWFGCGFASLLLVVMGCVASGEKWKPETVGHLFLVVFAILLGPIALFLAVVLVTMGIAKFLSERIDWDKLMNKPIPSIKITFDDEKENNNG